MHLPALTIRTFVIALLISACAPEYAPRRDLDPQFKRLEPAYDFSLADEGGKKHSLSQYRGKVVLINFWASWCVACIQEMPALNNLYRHLGAENFVVLGINAEDKLERVLQVKKKTGVEFPLLLDKAQLVTKAYKVSALPQTFVVDRAGNLVSFPDPQSAVPVSRMVGPRDWDAPQMVRTMKFLMQK